MRVSMILSALGSIVLAGKATAAATSINTDHGPRIEADLIADGYDILVSTFTGAFGPDGETMSFKGTVQEVMTQILAINPRYDFNTTDSGLEARADDGWRDRDVAYKDCKVGDFAQEWYIWEGVKHLRGLGGKCIITSKACSRVSCSYNAAIWVCGNPISHSPEGYKMPWDHVADYADGIAAGEWCDREGGSWSAGRVKGKVWNSNGMSVRVGKDKC